MARIETDPNYSSPTFSRATAGTDLFKKEDVQALAAAMSTHDHSSGKGVVLVAGSIPDGSITSAKIADGTIVAGDIADGAVTSAKILDGTIQAVDHADASVTNAKLAADTARANLLTNGGFEVWQRGNGPFTLSALMSADRWQFNNGGGSTHSISRDTANRDSGSGACAAVTYTHSTASAFLTYLTDQTPQLIGRTLSFSIRVKTNTASAVRATCTVVGGTGSTTGTVHTGDGTYQTLMVTTTVGAGATIIVVGLDFLVSCTAYIDNAMLVMGNVLAEYAPLHPADDLARCLRYYEVIGGTANGYPSILGQGTIANWQLSAAIGWKAVKAVMPTVTKNGTWAVTNCAQPGVDRNTVYGCRMYTAAIASGAFETFPADTAGTITAESNP